MSPVLNKNIHIQKVWITGTGSENMWNKIWSVYVFDLIAVTLTALYQLPSFSWFYEQLYWGPCDKSSTFLILWMIQRAERKDPVACSGAPLWYPLWSQGFSDMPILELHASVFVLFHQWWRQLTCPGIQMHSYNPSSFSQSSTENRYFCLLYWDSSIFFKLNPMKSQEGRIW